MRHLQARRHSTSNDVSLDFDFEMKLSKVIAIGSGLVAFLFMKLVVFGEPSSPSRVTFAQIEQEMMTPPSDEMFKAIKAAFPEEYRQHLETLATIANTREVDTQTLRTRAFTEGKSFTMNLRRENSEHVRNAPVEDLRNLLSASYNMINSVSDDKRLCAEIAANGLTNFTQSDVQKFDMSLVIESATVTFHAIAAGRETPHIREIPVGYDWGEFTKN